MHFVTCPVPIIVALMLVVPNIVQGQDLYEEKVVIDSSSSGVLTKISYYYSDTKKLEEESYYMNDTLHGRQTTYFENGMIMTEGFYHKGILDGNIISYYPNGTKSSVKVYSKGKPNGVFRYFDPKGNLKKELEYKDGLIWNTKYYSKYGSEVTHGSLKNGTGVYLKLNEIGDTIYIGNYVNGLLHGKEIIFDYDGFKSETNYVNGKAHGNCFTYYPNGAINSKGQIINGKVNDTAITYHRNGIVKSERFYVMGKEEGDSKIYDELGSLLYIERYKNDVLIEEIRHW